VILATYEPHSPEWFAARRWRVGGSEIGAVCGWSPYQTRDELLAAKISGEQGPTSAAMERGTFLEAGVLALACHREGLTLDPAASAATYVHDEHPWALFNPDGIAVDGVLVEAKTTADRANDRGWGRAGNGSIPAHYEAQVQWGLGILGLDRCLLAVLHGATNGRPDLDVARYRITANPAAFAFLLRRGAAFLEDLNQAKEAA